MPIDINSRLVRRNGADFVLVDDTDLGGGLRVVADVAARNSIPSSMLKVGMEVVVQLPGPPRLFHLTQVSPPVWVEGRSVVLEFPTFASFPSPGTVPGQLAWAQDEDVVYASVEGAWREAALSIGSHRSLRQLIHFLSNGPGRGFPSGSFREVIGAPFPSSVTWWESAAKIKKIVEKSIVRNPNQTPSVIAWTMYATDGVTIIETAIDTISYSGVFETSRTRSIT